MKIEDIRAREVLDSRGNPTIQVDCILEDGKIGRATVPSGASTGVYEAVELRDNDKTRYSGKGVRKAVSNVTNIIKRELVGRDIAEWESIDTTLIELDGTENKSNLGANAILGVSIAVIKAYSLYRGEPLYRVLGGPSSKVLPVPMVNILNGGVHADNNLDIQEFMIVPVGAPSFGEAIRYCVEVFHSLRNVLKERGLSTGLGDEGGFAPQLDNTREAIEIIISAIKRAGYREGKDIALAVDVAASELLKDDGTYKLDGTSFNADSLIAYYRELIDTYPIVSIEDGLAEEDWDGWKLLCQSLGEEIQLVGDDIFVTNTNRIKRGIEGKIANAVLIKPNQIGTVSETISAIELAHNNHWKTVVSHRSGETEDVFIADLSVAMNTGVIKTGSVARSERVAKYNRLLQIEEELEGEAIFYGKSALAQERK